MPKDIPKSYLTIINNFENRPEEIKIFFEELPDLLVNYIPWAPSIGYLFIKLETGLHNTLFGGLRKLHAVETSLAEKAVQTHELRRKDFQKLFKYIYGKPLGIDSIKYWDEASNIRNKAIHGKKIPPADCRKAIINALDLAEEINKQVLEIAKFLPFKASLQGLTGRAASLDKKTSKWVLMGMGFFHNNKN